MNRLKLYVPCLLLLFLCSFSRSAGAGTTPVHVDTEQGGNIDTGIRSQWDNDFENVNGAFFWNGTQWVTNDTAVHSYFTNLETGERFKIHHINDVDDSTSLLGVLPNIPAGYTVTKSLYSYTKDGKEPGISYTYQAVQYAVLQPDGTTIILRSRGTGNGTSDAYLDAFIEDGIGNTSALFGDPVLYYFSGLSATQAIAQTPALNSGNVLANLPTCNPGSTAQYWLDINGGSDMGGVTYHFHTQCLASARTVNWGSGFMSDFDIEFTDGQGEIQDIVFRPALVSQAVDGRTSVPTMNEWGMIIMSLMLVGSAVWMIRRRHIA